MYTLARFNWRSTSTHSRKTVFINMLFSLLIFVVLPWEMHDGISIPYSCETFSGKFVLDSYHGIYVHLNRPLGVVCTSTENRSTDNSSCDSSPELGGTWVSTLIVSAICLATWTNLAISSSFPSESTRFHRNTCGHSRGVQR